MSNNNNSMLNSKITSNRTRQYSVSVSTNQCPINSNLISTVILLISNKSINIF